MGQKDLSEKILEDYNDVFADIINGLIFHGEQRINPDDLQDASVHSQYKADDNQLHEMERDVEKYWDIGQIRLAILGLENQTVVDKNMPFRVIGYDGNAYRSQLLDNKKIVPVVTIVLYFGTKQHWCKERNIKSFFEIPEGMEPYVNDYKIHVFEIAWLTDEEIARFRSDFRIVANFFAQQRRNADYIPDDPTEIKHVDEVLKLLEVMTGDQRYTDVAMENGREVHNMCEVAERLERTGFIKGKTEGRTEGRIEGRAEEIIETGYEFGLSEEDILARLQKKLNISMQKAQEYLAMFGRQGV